MTADLQALRALLAAATPVIDRLEADDVSYGYFFVDDPRMFTPDPECSTEEERTRWTADCAAWERGERPALPRGCQDAKSGYGMGTNVLRDEEGKAAGQILREAPALLDELERLRDVSGEQFGPFGNRDLNNVRKELVRLRAFRDAVLAFHAHRTDKANFSKSATYLKLLDSENAAIAAERAAKEGEQ